MAPVKFGLFRARSRDQPDPLSTDTLLDSGYSMAMVNMESPGSPMNQHHEEAALRLQGDEQVCSESSVRRKSLNQDVNQGGEQSQINYKPLKNQQSMDFTSTSSLHDDGDEIHNLDETSDLKDTDSTLALDLDQDGASTSCDANSIQFDETSIAPSEDISVYCGGKRPKKMRSREEQQIRDLGMWQATNVEVMQNLLSRSGTMDEQIKWEAIATARGLCTLTDSCTCGDCARTKYLAGVTDGDGGLGAAPLFSAISVGCCLQ